MDHEVFLKGEFGSSDGKKCIRHSFNDINNTQRNPDEFYKNHLYKIKSFTFRKPDKLNLQTD